MDEMGSSTIVESTDFHEDTFDKREKLYGNDDSSPPMHSYLTAEGDGQQIDPICEEDQGENIHGDF